GFESSKDNPAVEENLLFTFPQSRIVELVNKSMTPQKCASTASIGLIQISRADQKTPSVEASA
ncbi:MAG: hypothetical protein NC924_08245, partial [Candidatus Omnitrophica bacterium]|nr:hypothetical protein [Candidatus Omnitrophota bacterium]